MSDAIHRAEHAKRILEDDLVKEALEILKTQTQALFFELPGAAKEEREFLHLMDRARQRFEQLFTSVIVNGEIERHEMLGRSRMEQAIRDARDKVLSR